jgi:hypothetical protein
VFTSIWMDPAFRALPLLAQHLYLFLLSQPDLSFAGVLPLRPQKWVRASSGHTAAKLGASLQVLESAAFVVSDTGTAELLVRSFVRRDAILRQPKLINPLTQALLQVESQRLRDVLSLELERALAEEPVNPRIRDAVAKLAENLKSQVDTLCHRVSDTLPHTLPDTHRSRSRSGVDVVDSGTGRDPVTARRPAQRAAAKGTRIPADFTVTVDMVAWAREHCPHADGRLQTEMFVNYWQAKSGQAATKVDWVATWRNWMLRAEQDAPHANGHRRPEPPVPASYDDRMEVRGGRNEVL